MISFIIPAHDEELLIAETLHALRTAMDKVGQPYEIIVVADACTDRTAEIAEKQGAKVIKVLKRQIAATRNAGARQAQGEVFFFVDADTWVNPAAIRAGLDAIRNGAVGGGCVFGFDGQLPLWARLLYPLAEGMARLLKLVGGCFLFCTREAFEAAGGFCESYYAAEEAVFIKALKKQGRFVVPPEKVVTSGRKLRAFSALEIIREAYRWAILGPESYRSREGLRLWYGQRRSDPMGQDNAER